LLTNSTELPRNKTEVPAATDTFVCVTDHASAIDWLLDSDPAIRWQVMRDLLDS
jgi:hypothetical protein